MPKYIIAPLTQISRHPHGSWNPKDYIGGPERLEELLGRFAPSDRAVLEWMLREKITTDDEIRAVLRRNENQLELALDALRAKNAAKIAAMGTSGLPGTAAETKEAA